MFKKTALCIFSIILTIIISLALLGAFNIISFDKLEQSQIINNICALIIILVILIVFYLLKPYIDNSSDKIFNRCFYGVLVLIFITQIICALALTLDGPGTWDYYHLLDIAREYVFSPHRFIEQNYLQYYPNNLPVEAFIIFLTKISIFLHTPVVSILVFTNALIMTFATFFCLVVFKKIFVKKSSVALAVILSFVLITISPHVAVIYTDTLGLFSVAISFASILWLMRRRDKRLFFIFMLGFAIVWGYLFKITTLIPIIATIIFYIFYLIYQRPSFTNKKQLCLYTIIFIFPIITVFSFYQFFSRNIIRQLSPAIAENRVNSIHFLGMGALRGLEPYKDCNRGGFCAPYILDRQALPTRKQRDAFSIAAFKNSVKTGFPFQYLGFIAKKTASIFSDGTFGVWVEGGAYNYVLTPVYHSHLFSLVRLYLAPRNGSGGVGKNFTHYAQFVQIFWLLTIILWVPYFIFLLKNKQELYIAIIIGISFIGIVAYQVLFECRSRYIFLYMPIFIYTATQGFSLLVDFLYNRIHKNR